MKKSEEIVKEVLSKTMLFDNKKDMVPYIAIACVEETIEECAKMCDNQSFAERCADDSMLGWSNAEPYMKMAKILRSLLEEQK